MSDFKVPAGWKLVPVEPTPKMTRTGGHVNSEWLNGAAPLFESRYAMPIPGIWKEMLAAAPQPPVHAENTSQERVRSEAEIEHEPFAHVHKRGSDDEEFVYPAAVNGPCPDCEPLYLHPPTLRMPEPMTQDALIGLVAMPTGFVEGLRAIEAEVMRRVMEANK